MELEFAFKHWSKLRDSPALQAKLAAIVTGQLPHAADTLAKLIAH